MFRRKEKASAADRSSTDEELAEAAAKDPATGPFDIDDIDLEDGVDRIDLGSLVFPVPEGLDVRLQVDQQSQEVQAVLVAGPKGAVELRAFAAPRAGDLWSEIRPQIAEDMTRRGGQVSEREGDHGTELLGAVPVQTSATEVASQPSRVVGVNGPRWLLRATFLGEPAVAPEDDKIWAEVLAGVAVRRGKEAMPVGEALPLILPANAVQQDG